AAVAPKPAKKGGMERGDVNVGAAGLEQGASPLRPDPRNHLFELVPSDDSRFDLLRKVGKVVLGDVKIAAHVQESHIREILRRTFQKITRRLAELGDVGPTVALQEERGGAARRMISALVFGLDDQRSPPGRNLRSQARPGDSSADDDDVKFAHLTLGYELESRAV